jgi:hypothetical protein
MKPLSKVTKERLMLVANRILSYPETYDQSVWISHDGSNPEEWELVGTKACIAGHAILFSRGWKGLLLIPDNEAKLKAADAKFFKAAAGFLGLSKRQAETLFFSWPSMWARELNLRKKPEEVASVAYNYIKSFIHNNGVFNL